MEIKRQDFRVGGAGANALAESMMSMNKWLKDRSVKPMNVETLVSTSSKAGVAGLSGVVTSEAVGVRLWYVEAEDC